MWKLLFFVPIFAFYVAAWIKAIKKWNGYHRDKDYVVLMLIVHAVLLAFIGIGLIGEELL